MAKTVLILGASGRFGCNAKAAFAWANWNVISYDRSVDSLPDAAWGADVIVNAWNPSYTDWAEDVPRLTQEVINTARDTGATVLIPGNIYNYGERMPEVLREETQHAPTSQLGVIRETMEQAYRDAGVRTIVLRAGDFIDTCASGNWFDKIITAKMHKGFVDYPGDLDTPHAWAFLHDLADVGVALADQADALPRFTQVNFPGYTLTARELHAALEEASGASLTLREMPWWPIRLSRPIWPMAKHLLEMRHLWNTPHSMASEAFDQYMPGFEPTPLVDALIASLPDKIDPDRMMPRSALHKRRPFNFCCGNAKVA